MLNRRIGARASLPLRFPGQLSANNTCLDFPCAFVVRNYNNRLSLIFRKQSKYHTMFEGPDFPKALDEEVFNQWLVNGRMSKIGYHYLIVVWDEFESAYQPIYVADREEIKTHNTSQSRERFIAAYDLYSESKII